MSVDIRALERLVDDTGLADELEAAIRALYKRPGRRRQLSVRTLLVGLLALSTTGSLHLIRLAPLLNALPAATRRRLGIEAITERQVQRTFDLVCRAIGGTAGLDDLCDRLLAATLPKVKTTSIAIDSTAIDSWGRRRRNKNTGVVVSSDPDAKWRGRNKATPWKLPVFGYDLTVAVTIPEVDGDDVPLVATSMRFRPAVGDTNGAGVDVAARSAALFGHLGDVVVDRGYNNSKSGKEFILPIRSLGGEPVFELYEHQRGVHRVVKGALIIDGNPFSPATPSQLHLIDPPDVSEPAATHWAYQKLIEQRALYAMCPHGSRHASGAQDFMCPAHKGKLNCHLVSSAISPTVQPALAAPPIAQPNSVCAKKFTRFDAHEIPLSQRDLFGSERWYQSYQRRSRVEGFFGNLKNEACENIRRGTIRVMGLVKTGLLVSIAVATVNLRLTRSFDKRPVVAKPKRRGRPRKNPLAVFQPQDVAVSLSQPNAPPT